MERTPVIAKDQYFTLNVGLSSGRDFLTQNPNRWPADA